MEGLEKAIEFVSSTSEIHQVRTIRVARGRGVVAEVPNPNRRTTKRPNTTVLGIGWKQVVTTVNYRTLRTD